MMPAIISADDALHRQEELDKQFAAMAAETEERDPNAIISADDALRRQEELDKQFAAMAAETAERDPNEIISADDALKRAEAMDALAKEAEDPMAVLLAADEEESAAPAAPLSLMMRQVRWPN